MRRALRGHDSRYCAVCALAPLTPTRTRMRRYMELIGKGRHGRGIVWVALRLPDGYVTAHANQARLA